MEKDLSNSKSGSYSISINGNVKGMQIQQGTDNSTQIYNVNTEIRSSTYKFVQALTYFVCYYMIQIKLPTISFGITMIIFCILYSLISLILVYKLAPKTFKIRI